ncbi:transcription-repair coupling factor, partial [Akkermansia sp.]
DKARKARAQASLKDINPGDLVVHTSYGIGKFINISTSPDSGDEEMNILYRDNTILHVPLSQAHLVSRYIGLGSRTPELNKLGDSKWQRAKKSAERSVADYAAQLLNVQAERQTGKGYSHPPDSKWMWEFESSFPFRETPDQLRAIAQTKADMESTRPMDRLICGDVGFGKTEVAIRAAFKCVTGGRQAAVLVPTTVLAEQHFRTFKSRMSEYPVRIEMLSRLNSAAEVKSTLEGLKNGSVDIVIGTHRLISEDVSIKNLGLVVIDEEQRFGVKHKEKFKERFKGIDVLTLSATPIPRTLYIALMGARDMSSIDTPPVNRQPVQTSVCPYDERIMKKAMERELERGGQIFLLHNRVKTIELFRDRIQALVPKARIVIGHGQMPKDELEKVMSSFVRGEADILLATTIIESGIDIPNANTIIIDRADRFGLADLYQLRGRVGRSGHRAYAYLMLPRSSSTTEDARKRVSAIKQYTELGSGFKIAMRDLEIRGAGNLLGTQQSGHIAAIGFDLYCQLLQQSISHMQGKHSAPRADAALRADFIVNSETQFAAKSRKEYLGAFIPRDYISDAPLRIAAYKDLAGARTIKETDALLRTWEDRFGPAPETVHHLLAAHKIKILATMANISMVEVSGQRLMLTRNGDFILLSNKFPRLAGITPAEKLQETLEMLKKI